MTAAVVSVVIFAVGGLVSAVGGIMLIVAAFQTGVLWGLAVLFLPFAGIVFAVAHWPEAKRAFMVSVAGLLICLGASVVMMAAGKPAAPANADGSAPKTGGGILEKVQARLESARSAMAARMKAATSRTGPVSYVGRPLQEVRAKLGRPKGEMRFGLKTALMYDEFMILSEDGETVQSIVDSEDFEAMKTEMAAAPAGPADASAKPAEAVKVISSGGAEVSLAAILVPGKITIVDFYADWCGPCRQMAPELEALVKQNPSAVLRKVDIVNWGTPVTKQYGISSVPNVRVFSSDGRMMGDPSSSIAEVRRYVEQAR